MGINNIVKELLIQELTTKKNAHNKKMNYSLLQKRGLSEFLNYVLEMD